MKPTRLIPILLLLLAASRVIHDLDYHGLWVDEGWSVTASEKSLGHVTSIVAKDVHPPFYFYWLYFWRLVTGDTVFAMRYLSMLITLLANAMVYRIGYDLFSSNIGRVALLLYVTHDLVRVLGQEVRQYPLLQFLAGLTLWCYWCLYQYPSRTHIIGFILSGIALLWTHYWGGFILLGIGIHAFVTKPHTIRLYLGLNACIGLSFLPWMLIVYQQTIKDLPEGIGHALPNSLDGYRILAYQLMGIPEIFWGVLFVAGIFLVTKRKTFLLQNSLLGLIVIVTVGLSITINAFYPSLSFRALSVVIPVFVVLVAAAIDQFRYPEQFVLIGFVVLQSVSTTSAAAPARLPWKNIANYLVENTRESEAILIETWFDTHALRYYLEQADPNMSILTTDLERRSRSTESFEGYLIENTATYRGVWVVRFAHEIDIRPQLVAAGFENTENIAWETDLGSTIDLWHFERVSQ